MKRGIFWGAMLLICVTAFGAETRRYSFVVNEDGTASSYTFKWDVDGDGYEAGEDGVGVETGGETADYSKIMVCNNDSADVLYVDANSTAGTQNTAVNNGTKSTSIPIFAGSCYVFRLQSTRTTISMICTAAQTCSNAAIYAGEPL